METILLIVIQLVGQIHLSESCSKCCFLWQVKWFWAMVAEGKSKHPPSFGNKFLPHLARSVHDGNHDGVVRILLHQSQWCGQNLRTSFLSASQECNHVVWKVSIPYILWIRHPTHAHPCLHTSHTLLRVLLAPLALLVHLVRKEPRVFLDQMAYPETMDDLDHLWVREGDASQNISVPVLGHGQKFSTVVLSLHHHTSYIVSTIT